MLTISRPDKLPRPIVRQSRQFQPARQVGILHRRSNGIDGQIDGLENQTDNLGDRTVCLDCLDNKIDYL